HLRERHVMSLRTLLGPRDPLMWERPESAALLEYDSFFLFRPPGGVMLDATWPAEDGPSGLRRAVEHLAEAAVTAAQHGSGMLVVSDENAGPELAREGRPRWGCRPGGRVDRVQAGRRGRRPEGSLKDGDLLRRLLPRRTDLRRRRHRARGHRPVLRGDAVADRRVRLRGDRR